MARKKTMNQEVIDALNYSEWKSLGQVTSTIERRWANEKRRSFFTSVYNFIFRKETYDTPLAGSVSFSLRLLEKDGIVRSREGLARTSSGVPTYGYKLD